MAACAAAILAMPINSIMLMSMSWHVRKAAWSSSPSTTSTTSLILAGLHDDDWAGPCPHRCPEEACPRSCPRSCLRCMLLQQSHRLGWPSRTSCSCIPLHWSHLLLAVLHPPELRGPLTGQRVSVFTLCSRTDSTSIALIATPVQISAVTASSDVDVVVESGARGAYQMVVVCDEH